MSFETRLKQLEESLLPGDRGSRFSEIEILVEKFQKGGLQRKEWDELDMFFRLYQYAGFLPPCDESWQLIKNGASLKSLIKRDEFEVFREYFNKRDTAGRIEIIHNMLLGVRYNRS